MTLAFTKAERVMMDIVLHYMANAIWRMQTLLGTVFSGLTLQLSGLSLMLGTALMVALSAIAVERLAASVPGAVQPEARHL